MIDDALKALQREPFERIIRKNSWADDLTEIIEAKSEIFPGA